jgi:hypothetical protein
VRVPPFCTFISHRVYARQFTLWRPRSEEMMRTRAHSIQDDPFAIAYMLNNIRELTLSETFRRVDLSESSLVASSFAPTLMPEHVPSLESIRLIDIDDAELLAVLLVGIADQIITLVIHPTEKRATQASFPRQVFATLRPVIESLSSFVCLTISLPSIHFGLSSRPLHRRHYTHPRISRPPPCQE